MSGYEISNAADVLFHDAQYRDREYVDHVGWGHSSISDTIAFAHKACVDRLVLFHHDPFHTDAELDDLLVDARTHCPIPPDRVCLAHEGMTITLDASGVRFGT